jgi:HlyD family secretion protein
MRALKRIALVAAVAALALGLGAALLPGAVPVEIAPVARGPLRVTVQAAGRTRVKARFVVSAAAAGHLGRVALRAGDPVWAGQELAWLEPGVPALLDARALAESRARAAAAASAQAEARANVERARVGLEHARAEAARVERLAQAQAIAHQAAETAGYEVLAREKDLALAERAVDRAARELEAARAVLTAGSSARRGERLALRSPAAGRVLRVLRDSEGPIAPGAPILEVGDPADLEAVIDVLTSQAVRIRPGAPAALEQWGGREPLEAKVAAIEPSGFTKVSALGVEEQRVAVVLVPGPGGWPALGDGFHVEARIVVHEESDALKAPAGALFRKGGDWAAFALENGRAALRTLRTGESTGDEVEIVDGLREGDGLILFPGDKVAQGVRLEPARR